MSLEAFFEEDDPKVNDVQTLSEKIKQRRTQMLMHSYIYYHLDDNIVSDDKWQQWANELASLQEMWNTLGMAKKIDFYDEAFGDWTGASGAFLPFDDWVKEKAEKLLRYNQEEAINKLSVA